MKKNVLVIGTGTIGEPLIGLLAEHKTALGIDNVYFYKRTPLSEEKGKVEALLRKGALLVSNDDSKSEFKKLGFDSKNLDDSYSESKVIIDCTPSGNKNWEAIYQHLDSDKRFLAQGSEHGFGPFYAWGINNEILDENKNTYLIASCNTHNIASIVKTFSIDNKKNLKQGKFVCLRRSNDVSQDDSFSPSPYISKHSSEQFGTHHARDVYELFQQSDIELDLFSSAIKIPTQYMHTLWFNLRFEEKIIKDEMLQYLQASNYLMETEKMSANKVFSFGRDHGYHGRILSHGVISKHSIHATEYELTGYCFTPQDGNALLSSVAATVNYFYQESWFEKMKVFDKYIFKNI